MGCAQPYLKQQIFIAGKSSFRIRKFVVNVAGGVGGVRSSLPADRWLAEQEAADLRTICALATGMPVPCLGRPSKLSNTDHTTLTRFLQSYRDS